RALWSTGRRMLFMAFLAAPDGWLSAVPQHTTVSAQTARTKRGPGVSKCPGSEPCQYGDNGERPGVAVLAAPWSGADHPAGDGQLAAAPLVAHKAACTDALVLHRRDQES